MSSQHGNGRRSGEDDRKHWRPTDDYESTRARRGAGEDDDRERGFRGRGRDEAWDRDEGYRPTERYGQGQSGYTAGRYELEEDRSLRFGARNQSYPGSFDERMRERGAAGFDERFAVGRGGESWGPSGRERMDLGTGGGHGGRYYYGDREEAGPEGPRDYDRRDFGGYIGRSGGGHRGKGPANYQRSDERLREIVCEALTDDDRVDASHIEVSVQNGEVTLSGTVDDRRQKRLAEECVEDIAGVHDVQNQLRVRDTAHRGGDKRHRT
jgi:hypothetical protein